MLIIEEDSPLSARLLSYLQSRAGVFFEPEELIYIPSLSGCKNKEAMRKQLERLRKKGLIDSEDRVKDVQNGRSGKARYRVYCFAHTHVLSEKSQSQTASYAQDIPDFGFSHVLSGEVLPDNDPVAQDTGDRIYEGVGKNSKVIIADLTTLLQIRPNFPEEYQTAVYKVLNLEEENAKCQFNGQIFSLPLQCLQVATYDPRDPF
jgi:hypothetical protein